MLPREGEAPPQITLPDPRLPSLPADQSEAVRLRMAERGRKDLYFLCKVILGYKFLRPEPHLELCRFIDETDVTDDGDGWNRRAIFMPRSTYKTTIKTIGHTIKCVLNNPNERILVIADTAINAQRFLYGMRMHFEHNQLFRWLYPDLIWKNFNTAKRWNNSELEVPRTENWSEPTIDGIGAFGGIESRHYSRIHPDDLITEKHIHSDQEMDKLSEWMGGLEPLLINDSYPIDFVGSRKKKGDAYERIQRVFSGIEEGEIPRVPIGPHAEAVGDIIVYSRNVRENGQIIFPYDKETRTGLSEKYLHRMKTFYPERYHAQMANDPKASGLNTFRKEDICHYTIDRRGFIVCEHKGRPTLRQHPMDMERIILFDPSVAEKKTSSKNAIIVLGRGYLPYRVILEARIGHFLPDEAIDLLFELDSKWMPSFTSIERRGFQGSIKYWLYEKANREHRLPPNVIEYPIEGSIRAQWAKKEVIKAMQPGFKHHLFWFPADKTVDTASLEEDVEFYPNVRYDDGLDCLAQSLDHWDGLIDDAQALAEKRVEQEKLAERGLFLPVKDESEEWNEAAFLSSLDATGYGLNPNAVEVTRPYNSFTH